MYLVVYSATPGWTILDYDLGSPRLLITLKRESIRRKRGAVVGEREIQDKDGKKKAKAIRDLGDDIVCRPKNFRYPPPTVARDV